jgi:Mg-chelatase subunit ChlI
MDDSIYIFTNLTEKQIDTMSLTIPLLSSGTRTVVFIDDFCNLDEDLQEELLETNPTEIE